MDDMFKQGPECPSDRVDNGLPPRSPSILEDGEPSLLGTVPTPSWDQLDHTVLLFLNSGSQSNATSVLLKEEGNTTVPL